jgi:hypothetical protein
MEDSRFRDWGNHYAFVFQLEFVACSTSVMHGASSSGQNILYYTQGIRRSIICMQQQDDAT